MDPEFMLARGTLDVEEFLYDVSVHLRRREMKRLLNFIGLASKEIDSLLYENMPHTWTERGLLTNQGTVIEESRSINFMQQRKKTMQTWWEYAANTKQRNTLLHQKQKVVESTACPLPQIPEQKSDVKNKNILEDSVKEKDSVPFPPIQPISTKKHFHDSISTEEQRSIDASTATNISSNDRSSKNIDAWNENSNRDDTYFRGLKDETQQSIQNITVITANRPSSYVNSNDFVERQKTNLPFPNVSQLSETLSDKITTNSRMNLSGSLIMSDKSQQTEIVGCDIPPDEVAIFGSNVTLEELIRKLWKGLQSCGLNRVIDELKERWMIRVNVNQGRADMYPKMTWGTPLPPQTPFTYPPYKKIGHMAVMGSTMSIESRLQMYPSSDSSPRHLKFDTESLTTSRSLNTESTSRAKFMPISTRNYSKLRSAQSRGLTSISIDGAPVSSFPTRDAWKLRTDTVRRKGALISVHIMVDEVALPVQPSGAWCTNLNVTTNQIRERVARVFLSHALEDKKNLCRTVDRIERIRGFVVESALSRIGGGGNAIEMTSSELVLHSRCLYPETVKQLWLLYQSGQLREAVQAGLVTKRSLLACSVEYLRLGVVILEDDYRRVLGLLRRKPMPNTKSGRIYVTTGTGGAIGGVAGIANAQKQALVAVTQYMQLPDPTPNFDIMNFPEKPGPTLIPNNRPFESGFKHSGNLIQKVLTKELDALKERLRMCEDTWCEFASTQFTYMLRCARQVMRRRIVGATAKNQLTPRCTSLSIFSALYKAIKSPKTGGLVSTPRPNNITSISGNHSSIALYPSDVTFSNVDLVTTVDDDDEVIKARKREEMDFIQGYATFMDMISELGLCRNILQDRIINRLTTNPTVAPSKQLYIAKDIYTLMERWRNHLAKDFNFANDETVQRFSSRILSNDIVTTSFDREIQEQFPGIVGLLPMIFHIAEQIMSKVRELMPKSPQYESTLYSNISSSKNIPPRHLSMWLKT